MIFEARSLDLGPLFPPLGDRPEPIAIQQPLMGWATGPWRSAITLNS
jgi:hypothetical protein